MKFCLYLISKGIITAQQLVAALEVQHEKLAPVGQLAMEEGILSARNVFKVLRCQSDLPHERFGEMAVELGLMTHDQLRHLLILQFSRQPKLLDILINQGSISSAQADKELAEFRRQMERRNVVVTRHVVARPHTSMAAKPAERTPDDSDYYAMMI